MGVTGALLGVAAGAQIAGAKSSADSARENADFQAEVAIGNGQFQQQVAEQNAQLAERTAAIEESRVRRGGSARLGTMRATLAARGVQLTGSPLQAVAQQAFEEEQNALLVRLGGESRAREQRFAGDIAASRGLRSAIGTRFSGDILGGNIEAQAIGNTIQTIAGFGIGGGFSGLGGGGSAPVVGSIGGPGVGSLPSFAGEFA